MNKACKQIQGIFYFRQLFPAKMAEKDAHANTKISSKTLLAAKQDLPRDISSPNLLDNTGSEILPASVLLDTSSPKVYGQVWPPLLQITGRLQSNYS